MYSTINRNANSIRQSIAIRNNFGFCIEQFSQDLMKTESRCVMKYIFTSFSNGQFL